METKFERLAFKNNPAMNAETEEHRKIIEKYAGEGYRYTGYLPVKIGPSGKVLVVDMIFQK
ncbi:MAG: hypothetical protein U0M23_03910 [Acutalibacteraceae bacterium]|nr:hypothetical protein [Acutalibacteraceae bacterium]